MSQSDIGKATAADARSKQTRSFVRRVKAATARTQGGDSHCGPCRPAGGPICEDLPLCTPAGTGLHYVVTKRARISRREPVELDGAGR